MSQHAGQEPGRAKPVMPSNQSARTAAGAARGVRPVGRQPSSTNVAADRTANTPAPASVAAAPTTRATGATRAVPGAAAARAAAAKSGAAASMQSAAAQAAAQAAQDAADAMYAEMSRNAQTSAKQSAYSGPRATFRPVDKEEDRKTEYSTRAQWQERVSRPVATRSMTPEEMEEFRIVLEEIEQAPGGESIGFRFIKLQDASDQDIDTCIIIEYYSVARRGPKSTEIKTPVYRLKLPVPEHLRAKQEDIIRQAARRPPPRRGRNPLLPGSQAEADSSRADSRR